MCKICDNYAVYFIAKTLPGSRQEFCLSTSIPQCIAVSGTTTRLIIFFYQQIVKWYTLLQVIIEDHVVTFVSKLYIFIIFLYYRPFLPQNGNTSERPFCILIEAFVLDFQQLNIRWAFTGRRAFTGRKPLDFSLHILLNKNTRCFASKRVHPCDRRFIRTIIYLRIN